MLLCSLPRECFFILICFLFTEISLQETLECLAVTSLVASHLVNSVVDGVEVMAKPYFLEKLNITRFSVWQWINAQALCVFWFIPRLLGTGGGAKSRWRKRSVLFEKIAKIIFVFKTAGK